MGIGGDWNIQFCGGSQLRVPKRVLDVWEWKWELWM